MATSCQHPTKTYNWTQNQFECADCGAYWPAHFYPPPAPNTSGNSPGPAPPCPHMPGGMVVPNTLTGDLVCAQCGAVVLKKPVAAAPSAPCTHPSTAHSINRSTGDISCMRCGSYLWTLPGYGAGTPAGLPSYPVTNPSPEPPSVTTIKINCPVCWRQIELTDDWILSLLESLEKVDLDCCKRVRVYGDNGILARVNRAREDAIR